MTRHPPLPDGLEKTQPILRLDRVSLAYGRRPVLDGVTLSLSPGDYLGVVGPNGAGKSTLLLGLLGLLDPTSGQRWVKPGLRVGYVPQQGVLDPLFPLTVDDVIIMGVEMFGLPRPTAAALIKILAEAGIESMGHRLFRELSGGQRQRVLLARALAVSPDLLVMDEPTTGLDFPGELAIMDSLTRLHRQGRTIVLVTHLLNLVANHACTLAIVSDHRVITGTTVDLMTGPTLSSAFGVPVHVTRAGDRVVVHGDPSIMGPNPAASHSGPP